eukprot:409150_1
MAAVTDVDSRSCKLVYGFVHCTHNTSQDGFSETMIRRTVPDVVIWMCFQYYYLPEIFTQLQGVTLSKGGRSATSAYDRRINGCTLIHSMDNSEYRWHIKINKRNKSMMSIGVDMEMGALPSTLRSSRMRSHAFCTSLYYGYGAMNGYTVSRTRNIEYGSCYGTNDIVVVRLDLRKRTLSFSLNDTDQGIAFHGLQKHKHAYYKLGIRLAGYRDSVTIQSLGQY